MTPSADEVYVVEDFVVDDVTPPAPEGSRPVSETLADTIAGIEAIRNMPHKITGLRFGWPKIDWMLLGLGRQALVVLLAPTGSGKTTIMYHIIFNSAADIIREQSGETILVYSLEGDSADFVSRYLTFAHGVKAKHMMQGGSEIAEREGLNGRIARGYAEFEKFPIRLMTGIKDPAKIEADIIARAEEMPIAGVCIDNAQKLEFSDSGSGWSSHKKLAGHWADLALALGFPFVVLSQVTFKDGEYVAREAPEWEHAASLVACYERGHKGMTTVERLASNEARLGFKKRRGIGGLPPPLELRGDAETGRLYQLDEWESYDAQRRAEAAGYERYDG